MDTVVRLGDLLVRHRIAAGLGHAELARRSGLSERTLRDLERGATARPRRHSMRVLATALELSGPELSAFLASAQPGGVEVAVRVGSLFGREGELRSLAESVTGGRHRLISVTGPGGVGKSRLAAALATELAQRSWDVRTVDMSGWDDPSLVLEAVADAFGVGGSARLGPIERLAARLRDTRAVVVVDCMERLIAAAPDLAAVVRRCPGLTVVVTSRRPLRVTGESLLRLGPLPITAAAALFAARAGFEVDDGNREAVMAICRQVDGLPLAIELAAARVGLNKLNEGDDGHRSLRATIESSLEVVSANAGALFDLLGAFPGGAGLDDLETVVADPVAMLEALAELVDMSLVRVTISGGETRYSLPDTMREVARPSDRERRALAVHYLGRIGEGSSGEAANVRSAIGWAIAHEPALFGEAVVHGLFRHYEVSGRLAEGQAVLDRVGAGGRPKAWVHAGHLARLRGDLNAARRLGGLALQRLSPDDHDGRCRTHLMLGSVATDLRELTVSRRELHAALVHARKAGDLRLAGRVLNNLGTLAMERGRLADAERLLLAALEAKRRGDAGDIDCGRTLFNLAETAVDDGRFEVGLLYAQKAVGRLVSGGHRRLAASAATTAALAHLHRGEVGAAVAACGRATELLHEEGQDDRRTPVVIGLRRSVAAHAAGDPAGAAALLRQAIPAGLENPKRDQEEIAYALEMHADLISGRDPVTAARLLGTAGQLRHGSIRPVTPAWDRVSRHAAATCRERLGENIFDRHYRQAFSLDGQGLGEMFAILTARRRSAGSPRSSQGQNSNP